MNSTAALGAIGLGIALLSLRPSRPRSTRRSDERRHAFIAYLRDHLTGSDVAFHTVQRLAQSHRDAPEGALFATLYAELAGERQVVRALLSDLGASPRSLKRLAGQAAGTAVKFAAGGQPGDLSLFRTLEGLATAVQGKRSLWRAAQALPALRAPGNRTFAELEADAVRQWEGIERLRLAIVPETFSAS